MRTSVLPFFSRIERVMCSPIPPVDPTRRNVLYGRFWVMTAEMRTLEEKGSCGLEERLLEEMNQSTLKKSPSSNRTDD
jgi:hypothetical protein